MSKSHEDYMETAKKVAKGLNAAAGDPLYAVDDRCARVNGPGGTHVGVTYETGWSGPSGWFVTCKPYTHSEDASHRRRYKLLGDGTLNEEKADKLHAFIAEAVETNRERRKDEDDRKRATDTHKTIMRVAFEGARLGDAVRLTPWGIESASGEILANTNASHRGMNVNLRIAGDPSNVIAALEKLEDLPVNFRVDVSGWDVDPTLAGKFAEAIVAARKAERGES